MLLSIASLKGDFGLTAQGHHLSTLDTVPALGFLNTTIRAGGGPRARGLLRMMSTMLSMPRVTPISITPTRTLAPRTDEAVALAADDCQFVPIPHW